MADENNPDLWIEYSEQAFPPSVWESLKEYAIDFKTENAGIFRVPQLTLKLRNKNGRFTGNGSITIKTAKFLRVRADVRGTTDTLFYGRVAPFSSNNKNKNEILSITGKGLIAQKLLWDTITKKYLIEQNEGAEDRNMKQVIEHMLANPDSGVDTGISLVASSNGITTTKAKHNFDRQSLLDAINQICEYIGYAGLQQISGSTREINLKPYGTDAASPSITIPVDEDDRKNIIEQGYSVDDPISNHICVWAATQTAYPDTDRYTENGVTKGYWSAESAGESVADSTEQKTVNNKSIKLTGNGGTMEWLLDLSGDFPSGLDLADVGLTIFVFHLYTALEELYANELLIELEDSLGNKIWYQKSGSYGNPHFKQNEWSTYEIPLGRINDQGEWEAERITSWTHATLGRWNALTSGDYDFNWKIVKIKFRNIASAGSYTYYLDGAHFQGAIEINPIVDTALAATDATSITAYDRRVLHYDMPALRDYSAISPLAEKVLLCTKNPIVKLMLKYGAKTWALPNQTITTNMPVYGISSKPYRIVQIDFDWATKTKLLRSTFHLTPQFLADDVTVRPVTSREWYAGELNRILKDLLW